MHKKSNSAVIFIKLEETSTQENIHLLCIAIYWQLAITTSKHIKYKILQTCEIYGLETNNFFLHKFVLFTDKTIKLFDQVAVFGSKMDEI